MIFYKKFPGLLNFAWMKDWYERLLCDFVCLLQTRKFINVDWLSFIFAALKYLKLSKNKLISLEYFTVLKVQYDIRLKCKLKILQASSPDQNYFKVILTDDQYFDIVLLLSTLKIFARLKHQCWPHVHVHVFVVLSKKIV